MIVEILVFVAGVAVGFFIRHAYPAKFGEAEKIADEIKAEYDRRK